MLRPYVQAISVRPRKAKLERALGEYPLYDPPHKVEEYLLSREQAAENFDYFMRVRLERVAYFQGWLQRHFGVTVTLDEQGVRALSRWGNKYAGFLLVKGTDGGPNRSYFTYDPPWMGENAGHNVLLDMGITLGEAIIANCPKVHWDFDPISAILPRTAQMLKRSRGLSFQRPMLTGFDNPAYGPKPLHDVYGFADRMMHSMTTLEDINRFYSLTRFRRRVISEQLVNRFKQTLQDYPDGDPANLRKEMGSEEYLKNVDSESADKDDSDD